MYNLAHVFLKFYWFIFRPKTRGAKCLIEHDGKFLLVKLNYAHKMWTIPGGGVNKGETFLNAAVREAKEETGLAVFNPVFIGYYKNAREYKRDTVEVYLATTNKKEFKLDPIEIQKAAWFKEGDLPKDCTPSVYRIFEFYNEYKK